MSLTFAAAPLLAMVAGWPLITIREAYGPIRAPERMKEVLDLHARYPKACEEVWLAHGAGAHLDDVRTAFEKLAAYRPRLREIGIEPGFQQGVTLGHQNIVATEGGGLEGRLADFPDDIWQRDADGKVRRMFCPRSPALHEYETAYLKIMGETLSPVSIWFDDDLRLGLSVPGCHCDRCITAFGEFWGEPITREALVARLKGGVEKDPIRRAWRQFKAQSLAEYGKMVRRATDTWQTPPRLALQAVGSCEMGSGMDWLPILRAFSGEDNRPVGIRAGHGSYREDFAELLPKLLWLGRESERCRAAGFVASVSYEQENYRREILHKSVGAALLESALALFAGCDALTEYRWDSERDEPLEDLEEFLAGLEAWRPFYQRVSDMILKTHAAGLARYHGSDVDLLVSDTISVEHDDNLQRLGIPVAPIDSPKASSLYIDYTSLPALSPEDIKKLAKKPLIVDTAMVDGLLERDAETVRAALDSGLWKPYEFNRFRWAWNQIPSTVEWNELLDQMDAAGLQPARLEFPRKFRIWPRVDKAGQLKALAVWNMSIGGATPTPVRVAAAGTAKGYFPDGRTVDLPITDGHLKLPALPPMGIIWLEFN